LKKNHPARTSSSWRPHALVSKASYTGSLWLFLCENTSSCDTRDFCQVPTIKYLLEQGARVAISSHLGRPKVTSPPLTPHAHVYTCDQYARRRFVVYIHTETLKHIRRYTCVRGGGTFPFFSFFLFQAPCVRTAPVCALLNI
jgi:hypothetical protein